MTDEDLVDAIWESLRDYRTREGSKNKAGKDSGRQGKWGAALREDYNRPYTSLPSGRIFFSEFEIKRMIQNDRTLKLPKRSIVSPLAQDWLILKGIKVIKED